jgi:hypothetical protein
MGCLNSKNNYSHGAVGWVLLLATVFSSGCSPLARCTTSDFLSANFDQQEAPTQFAGPSGSPEEKNSKRFLRAVFQTKSNSLETPTAENDNGSKKN